MARRTKQAEIEDLKGQLEELRKTKDHWYKVVRDQDAASIRQCRNMWALRCAIKAAQDALTVGEEMFQHSTYFSAEARALMGDLLRVVRQRLKGGG